MSSPEELNVSRETFERLSTYVALLKKWNPRINLVSRSSIDDVWSRHIMDSVQLFSLAPKPCKIWADLGSGGGFPGLVIAIMAMEAGSPTEVVLVESDQRKSAFLRTVIRETGAPARVITGRIEDIKSLTADILSARALADLSGLLAFAQRHLAPNGTALFPKGVQWEKEVSNAQTQWNFDYEVVKSQTEDGPVILSVTGVSRA